MIFGHFGLALLFKAKFYRRSLILILICCYLPDILFYIFFGIQWTLTMPYSSVFNGLLKWILSITGTTITLVDYPLPLSHSIIIYFIFGIFFLLIYFMKKHSIAGLFYLGIIFIHLLFDFLLPDVTFGVPIVYPLYPFDPVLTHAFPYLFIDADIFWLIDLTIFLVGFFVILWAFSKKEGRTDFELSSEIKSC